MVLSDTSVTRGQCWGESKQQKREVMLKGLWQGPSDQTGCQMFFLLLLSQLCFLRRAPAEWNCPQQEEKWNLPGFRLLPWGWGWRMWENIHYLPVLAFPLEGLICFFVPLKQHFPNTYKGVHRPSILGSIFHYHTLDIFLYFFLDSLDTNWLCQHAELQWQKPRRRQTSGIHGLLLPDSSFLSIIWV